MHTNIATISHPNIRQMSPPPAHDIIPITARNTFHLSSDAPIKTLHTITPHVQFQERARAHTLLLDLLSLFTILCSFPSLPNLAYLQRHYNTTQSQDAEQPRHHLVGGFGRFEHFLRCLCAFYYVIDVVILVVSVCMCADWRVGRGPHGAKGRKSE